MKKQFKPNQTLYLKGLSWDTRAVVMRVKFIRYLDANETTPYIDFWTCEYVPTDCLVDTPDGELKRNSNKLFESKIEVKLT